MTGPELLVWIAGPDYLVNRELFVGLVLAIGLFGFFQIIQYILMLNKTTFGVSMLVLSGGIMNVLLNWFLVTQFSVLGAVISNCLTNFVLIILGLYHTRKILSLRVPLVELFWFLFTAIFAFIVGYNILIDNSYLFFYHFSISIFIVVVSFFALFILVPRTSIIISLREL